MTYEKTMHEENESNIEIVVLIKCVAEKWKSLAISALICALVGVIFAAVTYVPVYTSTISYVINSRATSASDSELRLDNFLVVEYLSENYSYIITSRDFVQRIQAETGYTDDISEYISSGLVEGSSIMKITVKSTDPEKSFRIADAIHTYLPEKAKETVRSGSLDLLETPVKAIKPNANSDIPKMGLLGALIGAFLAAAVIVVLQLIKNPVMTPNALTSKIDIQYVGSVPHVELKNNKKKTAAGKAVHEPMLVTNKKTGFVFNETYKSMRTKIERYSKKNNCKAILVTSALENEGKTTVAANIALSLAQNNNRVIMLDCDLRKPAVGKILDIKEVKTSALDVITGQATVDQAIVHVPNAKIDAICGGKAVGNSSEILSTSGLRKTIEALREMYDYIIVDTPPSQLFTDAVIISEYTDAAILVVRQNSANVDDVISVANDVSQSNADLIGFVFNNVTDTSILPGGYSKKYNYSYYGYGNVRD